MAFDLEHDVAVAESAVATLHEKQRQERGTVTKRQLLDIRKLLREKRDEYGPLATGILQQQDERLQRQRMVIAMNDGIAAHLRHRPEVADVLGLEDDEVRDWQAQHDKLIAERNVASKLIPPEPSKVYALQLAHEIQRLEFSEKNLLRLLRGDLGRIEGGLYRVA